MSPGPMLTGDILNFDTRPSRNEVLETPLSENILVTLPHPVVGSISFIVNYCLDATGHRVE